MKSPNPWVGAKLKHYYRNAYIIFVCTSSACFRNNIYVFWRQIYIRIWYLHAHTYMNLSRVDPSGIWRLRGKLTIGSIWWESWWHSSYRLDFWGYTPRRVRTGNNPGHSIRGVPCSGTLPCTPYSTPGTKFIFYYYINEQINQKIMHTWMVGFENDIYKQVLKQFQMWIKTPVDHTGTL